MIEQWVLVIEDLYGGFELVKWFTDENFAKESFDEWIGEDESEPDYPDKEGRDCILLHVVSRGDDRWQKYLESLRPSNQKAIKNEM